MFNFDMTWVAFGLFLLGCGGVPAVAALLAERRRGDAWGRSEIGEFQEEVQAASPGALRRARNIQASLNWSASLGTQAYPN
jgi:hypothetical protein